MNNIVSYIKTFFIKEAQKPLGRWKIEYCVKTLNHKIDLANEDNCGPCGQYINNKLRDTNVVYTKRDTLNNKK